MKVLVLSPHTDDGELWAGGLIIKLIEKGYNIHYLAYSYPSDNLLDECRNATKKLGVLMTTILKYPIRNLGDHRQEILQGLWIIAQENNPHIVLCPDRLDTHQDHKVICNEAIRAFRRSTIIGYISPVNHLETKENYWISLTEEQLEQKLAALAMYHSQRERFYFKEEYQRAYARVKGSLIGAPYAESFELIVQRNQI